MRALASRSATRRPASSHEAPFMAMAALACPAAGRTPGGGKILPWLPRVTAPWSDFRTVSSETFFRLAFRHAKP
jgi:hypothetical protein